MNGYASSALDPLPAVITGSATFSAAILAAIAAYLSSKRDRRRQLYGDAFKAVMSWHEMLFRVLRRRAGMDDELIDKFHDIQEQISYFSGWIGSESWAMRQSYERFTKQVKDHTRDPIRTAWANPTQSPEIFMSNHDDTITGLNRYVDDFLRDVRSHLSPFQLGKIKLFVREVWRSRSR